MGAPSGATWKVFVTGGKSRPASRMHASRRRIPSSASTRSAPPAARISATTSSRIAGRAATEWTLALKSEVVLLGAGALMSFRTGWSLLAGALLTYAVLAPRLLAEGAIAGTGYKAIVAWTLWPGAAILVAAGLTSFVLDGKSVLRSFAGLGALVTRRAPDDDPLAEVETPPAWFPIGFAVLSPIVVFLMVRQMNRLKRKEEAAPVPTPATPEDIVLLREIRDSLRR